MFGRKGKKSKIFDSYVIIFSILVVLAALTYIIPAGSYERSLNSVNSITYVVPGSYKEIPNTPVSFFQLFKSIPQGMIDGSGIIIFVFIVGGCFGIITSTGVMNRSISLLTHKFRGKESLVIPILMTTFALFGTIFGSAEELLPFCPVVIALFMALGMDRMTGVAVVLIGGCAGFAAGVLNPFTTGIAQQIVELPLFSGISLRIGAFFIFLITGIIYVMKYAKKMKVPVEPEKDTASSPKCLKLKNRDLGMLLFIALSIFFIGYGVLKLNFDTIDISTVFIIIGIGVGLISGLNSNRIVTEFVKGASSLVYGALIIGMARAIFVIMEYGQITDTLIFHSTAILHNIKPIVGSPLMYVFHTAVNFFLSSATGQASVTMPIIKNIADLSGITRQTAVLAFQFGDGLSNLVFPTSGYMMACLAISHVKWREWIKVMLPLFMILSFEAILILMFSTVIHYGPF